MRFSRTRYITLCQQSLVTAAVLAVGVSAAGVKTLDIVPTPGTAPGPIAGPVAGAGGIVAGGMTRRAPAVPAAEPQQRTEVDVAPVKPKVREVKVPGISARTPPPQRQAAPGAEEQAPRTSTSPAPAPAPAAGSSATPEPAKRLVALSDPQPVNGYATVGVTWRHGVKYSEEHLAVQIRTEKAGVWSSWRTAAYHDDHGPDGSSTEEEARAERPGTDALVIGAVDRVQMRTETTDGTLPPDLRLAVIDPGAGAMTTAAPAIDTSELASPRGAAQGAAALPEESVGPEGEEPLTASPSAMKAAPKPYIYSRAQWGANEKMREQTRPSMGTVKAGFIHHTVNANNYSSAQVPALLRGIYAYHTQSRGWRDLGYNFLVDRFGRIWEGRYGGVNSPVVGAHTAGYNEVSFAMSAIGNFDVTAPPQAVSDAYARLFAWKLSLYRIRADNPRTYVKNRYLRAINGHRDVGQTACPGRHLYAKLPSIRTAAQRLQNAAQGGAPAPAPAPVPAPAPAPAPAPNASGFTSPTQTPRPATHQPADLRFPRTMNLAGDAHPDLVLKSRTGVVQVVPTGGQTGFLAPVRTRGPWARMDLIAAVGDITGDGKGDVIGRDRSNRLTRVYRGDGTGRVSTAGVLPTALFRYANLIIGAGDWNRDGRRDVLYRDTKTGWLMMAPGLGNGRFARPLLQSKSWKKFVAVAVPGDLTGDGRPDVTGLHRNGRLYAATNRTKRGLTKLTKLAKREYVGAGYNALVGGAGDMSGDAYGDVMLRSRATGSSLLLPGKRGTFAAKLGPFAQTRGLTRLSAAQMVGSAHPDLVGTNATGTELVVVPHNGRVNLRPALASNLTRADATQLLNVGDWNRDGRGDVITRQTGRDALVLRPGLGNGKFANGIVMGRGWKSFTSLAAVGDVTGDGLPDLVGKRSTGKTTIFPGNGAHGFRAPVTAPNYLKSYNQIGDGYWKPQYLPGSAYASADGSFVPFMGTGVGRLAGYDWVIGSGDLDGDGRNDLVARDARGTLWLLPGTTSGLAGRRLLAAGFSGYQLGG